MLSRMAYPYSPEETLADGVVHGLGLLLAVAGVAMLLIYRADTAAMVYCICTLAALIASAIYHMTPIDRLRPLLARIDHAAIYLKIAGTYTPFAVLIGSPLSYTILTIIWALALFGVIAKLWFWPPNAPGSLALYLGMGWLSVLLIYPMWHQLPRSAMVLIVMGGLTYTAGTIVFVQKAMRYQNAIWHGFVLTASGFFFAAMWISLNPSS